MRMTVNVTALHIDLGRPNDGARCPIALAIRDQLPRCSDVDVGDRWIAVAVAPSEQRGEAAHLRVRTPRDADEFVFRFDMGVLVEPTSFVLDFEPADPTA